MDAAQLDNHLKELYIMKTTLEQMIEKFEDALMEMCLKDQAKALEYKEAMNAHIEKTIEEMKQK